MRIRDDSGLEAIPLRLEPDGSLRVSMCLFSMYFIITLKQIAKYRITTACAIGTLIVNR